jgi:hypothetical protein
MDEGTKIDTMAREVCEMFSDLKSPSLEEFVIMKLLETNCNLEKTVQAVLESYNSQVFALDRFRGNTAPCTHDS